MKKPECSRVSVEFSFSFGKCNNFFSVMISARTFIMSHQDCILRSSNAMSLDPLSIYSLERGALRIFEELTFNIQISLKEHFYTHTAYTCETVHM